MRPVKKLLPVIVFLPLMACAAYTADPLPETANFTTYSEQEAGQPLTMTAVAGLAVIQNPDLKIERAKKQVASAQAFQAGLLPNPQLSAGIDHPTSSGAGLVNGYSYGLTFDFLSLLLHPTMMSMTKALQEQAREDLLWQEWQTVAKARQLYVQAGIAHSRLHLLSSNQTALNMDVSVLHAAVSRGDLAPDQADSNLSLVLDLQSQIGAADRRGTSARQDIKALLGIAPDALIRLAPLDLPVIPDAKAIDAALLAVTKKRPDFLALQQGYAAQEEALFKAVLSQFPNLQVGFTKASDTSDVQTVNFGITLDLPIFDRGQGRIATEQATRKQLKAEYQARIDQTQSDAWKLQTEMKQISRRLETLENAIPSIKARALAATQASHQGDLSLLEKIQFIQSWLARENEILDLKEALWNDAIALDTILALPLGGPDSSDKETQ